MRPKRTSKKPLPSLEGPGGRLAGSQHPKRKRRQPERTARREAGPDPSMLKGRKIKPIPGAGDRYLITDDGRVWSIFANRFLSTKRRIPKESGYVTVSLHRRGKLLRQCLAHRVVAENYLPPRPTPKHEINHINGIKWDNRTENLEWVTRSENILHADRIGLRQLGENHHLAKLSNSEILRIRSLEGRYTQAALARRFKVTQSAISKIINKRQRP